MNYHINISHIVNLAFRLSICLENKRALDINDLSSFYKCLATEMTQLLKDPYFIKEQDLYMETTEQINFDNNFDIKELTDFIEENSDIYSFDGKTIKMSDKVSYKALEDLSCDLDDAPKAERWVVMNLLSYLQYDLTAIRKLNLTKFQKIFDAWMLFEMNIETNKSNMISDEEISKIRKNFFEKFNLSFEGTLPFRTLQSVIQSASYIKAKIMDYSIYKNDEQDAIYDISHLNNWNFVADKFIKAIFTRDFLFWENMLKALDDNKPENYYELMEKEVAAWNEEIDPDEPEIEPIEGWEEFLKRKSQEEDFDVEDYDEDEDYDEEEYDEEDIEKEAEESNKRRFGNKVFILKFLENADFYLNIHQDNKELQETIARIIFVDNKTFPINTKEERALSLKNIQDYSFDYIEYDYSATALYLIDDIFRHENPDNLMAKILFIKTVWQLFPKEEHVEAFEKYKNHSKYEEYFEMIFGDSKDFNSERKRLKK